MKVPRTAESATLAGGRQELTSAKNEPACMLLPCRRADLRPTVFPQRRRSANGFRANLDRTEACLWYRVQGPACGVGAGSHVGWVRGVFMAPSLGCGGAGL